MRRDICSAFWLELWTALTAAIQGTGLVDTANPSPSDIP
jgi:hypothetical protein